LHVEWVVDTVFHTLDTGKSVRRQYGLFFPADRLGPITGIRTYDETDRSRWLTEQVIEYETSNDSWPAIKSLETHVTYKLAGDQMRRVSRIDLHEFRRLPAPPPETDFTLSAFGLPEPKKLPDDASGGVMIGTTNDAIPFNPKSESTNRNWWLWVLIAMFIFGCGIAFAVHRRRSRTS
jgi:hypothetical protein